MGFNFSDQSEVEKLLGNIINRLEIYFADYNLSDEDID